MSREQHAQHALDCHRRAMTEAAALWTAKREGEARQRVKRAQRAYARFPEMSARIKNNY